MELYIWRLEKIHPTKDIDSVWFIECVWLRESDEDSILMSEIYQYSVIYQLSVPVSMTLIKNQFLILNVYLYFILFVVNIWSITFPGSTKLHCNIQVWIQLVRENKLTHLNGDGSRSS